MTDRRESQRLEKKFQVKIEHGTFIGVSEDLSKGGMFLRTARTFRRGARIHLQIDLPNGWTDAEAVVCWSRQMKNNIDAGVGLKFVNLSAEMAAYLTRSEIPEGKVPVGHEEQRSDIGDSPYQNSKY